MGVRKQLTYANVGTTIALFLSLGFGGAYAADKLIGTDDIEKNAITSKLIDNGQIKSKDLKDSKAVKGIDVKDASLDGADILDGGVATADLAAGAVDSSKVLDGTLVAGDLIGQERFHRLGAPGEPALGNGGQGDCVWTDAGTVLTGLDSPGFRIDRFGTVELSGTVVPTPVAGAGDEECGATVPPDPVDDSQEDIVVFTLPPAYRPAKSKLFPSDIGGNGQILIVVGVDGLTAPGGVLPPGTVAANILSDGLLMDGVTFPAAGAGVTRAPSASAPFGELDLGVGGILEGE